MSASKPNTQLRRVADLRFGQAPTIDPAPGVDPAVDAKALIAPDYPSPAVEPIPGTLTFYRERSGRRHLLRIPRDWNGSLVVAGTPATRSEFANDAVWSDLALSRGFAFASSNKGVPYNAIMETSQDVPTSEVAYPIPFDLHELERKQMVVRMGALHPRRIGILSWNEDFRHLLEFARTLLRLQRGTLPKHTYAVGLSNGGAQVRTALERFPELIDGGVECAAVRWTPECSILDQLPRFLRAMPAYIESGFVNAEVHAEIENAGFPADTLQDDPAHPSLWFEYYANVLPFYADVTVFLYAMLVDPKAHASFLPNPAIPHPRDPRRLPGTIHGTGLALPEERANYVPSDQAREAIAAFAHTGAIQRPLISVAGLRDILIPPEFHALGYARSVAEAGRGDLHRLYLVENATHVDGFVPFGYGLRPLVPFAWAAFDQLVRTVERGDATGIGTTRTVAFPDEIA